MRQERLALPLLRSLQICHHVDRRPARTVAISQQLRIALDLRGPEAAALPTAPEGVEEDGGDEGGFVGEILQTIKRDPGGPSELRLLLDHLRLEGETEATGVFHTVSLHKNALMFAILTATLLSVNSANHNDF